MAPKEQKLLRDFLDVMLNYLQANPLEDNRVFNYQDYQSLETTLDTHIGAEGVTEKDLCINTGTSNLTLFISDQTHYSFLSAANILGIDNVISVKSDSLGRMEVEALESAIQISLKAGNKPFFIAATAGTTVLGAFDPINKIAAIAAKYQLWLHVDGAYCGSFLYFSISF